MKELQKKTKHHYVWAHYLKEWTIDGTNTFYITKKHNIACDSVRGLGYEKNFYKMGLLKESDHELIKLITKDCIPTLRDLHLNFVDEIFKTQSIVKEISASTSKNLGVDLQDLISSNLFENILSRQEIDAITLLKYLREDDASYFELTENYQHLCYFIGHQFARTLKMRNLLIHSLAMTEGPAKAKEALADFYSRNWWFMCSFFATNLSFDMSLNKNRSLLILNNTTESNFITSDQPVININPEKHLSEEVDYYYPLSPRKGLLILTSGNKYFDYKRITLTDVASLNEKIASSSGGIIFGKCREDIVKCKTTYVNRQNYNFNP